MELLKYSRQLQFKEIVEKNSYHTFSFNGIGS